MGWLFLASAIASRFYELQSKKCASNEFYKDTQQIFTAVGMKFALLMKVRRGDLFSSSSADACNSADEIRQAEPKWKSLGPWFNFWPSLSPTSLASEFMSTSGREVFIDGAVLGMRGNSLGLLPNAWGAFNRLPLKELPLLRVQFFMDTSRSFSVS
jgi:hypothetical protein